MELISIKTPLFRHGSNLIKFLLDNIPQLQERDILVITSKIVALSQGQTGSLEKKKELIIKESKRFIETPWALLTLTDDGWCINAGVDESNADNEIILPPKRPQVIARQVQKKLAEKFRLKHFGALITDTKSVPLRVGTVGRAIAYAGFQPLKSYIGKKDLFGKKSRFTKSNIADALAATAVLIMGEGDEQIPLVIIKNAPVEFTNKIKGQRKMDSLSLLPDNDIYAKVFRNSGLKFDGLSKKKRP